MLATVINAICVIVGSLVGLLIAKKINEGISKVIFDAAGISTLIIGISMALQTKHILYLVLSLMIGGILGYKLDIDGAILRLGERLKRLVYRGATQGENARAAKSGQLSTGTNFALGFLTSSVLFCVGAMAIVGSFKAGVEGDFTLLLTKSALDGFMSILLAATMGAGVAFSALSIFAYQGALTLLSVWLKDYVDLAMQAELSGLGGALVLMIGINLLKLKEIKTANYLPALIIVVLLMIAHPWIASLGLGI